MDKDVKMKPWKSECGITWLVPENYCVFCKHCTDIYFDFTHGPYMCFCEKLHEDFETCNSFEEG